jgi:hypothetical protein
VIFFFGECAAASSKERGVANAGFRYGSEVASSKDASRSQGAVLKGLAAPFLPCFSFYAEPKGCQYFLLVNCVHLFVTTLGEQCLFY